MSCLLDPATWRYSLGPRPQEACLWWVGMSLGAAVPLDGRDGDLGGMKRALCWSVSPQMPRALGMTSVQSRDICAEKVLLSSSQAVGLSQVQAVCSAL